MRVVGPNCLGVMSPVTGLNATFASAMARPGNVGFISQSGALCAAVLDWSFRENVGFSHFVSIGSMVDVGWGDLIDYLGHDARTRSIVIYMESIGDARAFMSAAREVALSKPIIVIKAGRTSAAARAAASHTGALTGSDEVLDAAFRRCGVLRVDTIAELFYMAEVLSKQPRPRGPRLTILTNAGGPGVLATDALIANGGQLTELSDDTMAALNALLPPHWSHSNPIDVLGDAGPERYAKALDVAGEGPQQRRAARHPDAAGRRRTHADRRADQAVREAHRQAGAGVVDGRVGRGRRRDHPQPARRADVPVSGHRRPHVRAHVGLQQQPQGPVRDAGAARRGGARERRAGVAQKPSCSRCAPPAAPC